jgi:hypothetical protein
VFRNAGLSFAVWVGRGLRTAQGCLTPEFAYVRLTHLGEGKVMLNHEGSFLGRKKIPGLTGDESLDRLGLRLTESSPCENAWAGNVARQSGDSAKRFLDVLQGTKYHLCPPLSLLRHFPS